MSGRRFVALKMKIYSRYNFAKRWCLYKNTGKDSVFNDATPCPQNNRKLP